MASERDQLAELYQVLVRHFVKDELRTLCFELDVEYENLPDTLEGMARELVRYCERYGRIPELIATGKRQRPDIPWDDVLETAQEAAWAPPRRPLASLPKQGRRFVEWDKRQLVLMFSVLLIAVFAIVLVRLWIAGALGRRAGGQAGLAADTPTATLGGMVAVPEGWVLIAIPPGASLTEAIEGLPSQRSSEIPPGIVEVFLGEESIRSGSAESLTDQRSVNTGAGFVVSEKGLIIMYDLFLEKDNEIYVRLSGEERIQPAWVVMRSPGTFLALLELPIGPTYPHLKLASAGAPLGDRVTKVNARFGAAEGRVTGVEGSTILTPSGGEPIIVRGVVTVEPGLSQGREGGSAVLNAQGEVVGVLIAGSTQPSRSLLIDSSKILKEFPMIPR